MPPNHSVGLDDVQGFSPIGPQATKEVPECSISPAQGRAGRISLQDLYLMPKGGILEDQGLASSED